MVPRKEHAMPLTVHQAEAEARWRWGSLISRGFARHESSLRRPFQVGTKTFGKVTIRGEGTSWESAFQNADAATNVAPK
jgi:hypothetical protein